MVNVRLAVVGGILLIIGGTAIALGVLPMPDALAVGGSPREHRESARADVGIPS
jgi:hypothetical protein